MAFTISFIAYTLIIVAVGVYSSRFARRSDEDYFLAGRSLNPWVAAISAGASAESGWVTLGLVGTAFASGTIAYWIVPGCLLGFLFNWFVIAGPMREKSAAVGALTVPDFFAKSFNERKPILRIMGVIVILTAMWLYVAAQFSAAGKSFDAAFDNVNYVWGVVIGTVIVLGYTVVGGFRAACWTDFLQGLVMVGVLVIFPIWLVVDLGGVDNMIASFNEYDAARKTTLAYPWPAATGFALIGFLFSGSGLGINFGYPGQPHVLVRFMALRSRKDAFIGGIVSSTWGFFVLGGAVTVGLVVRSLVIQKTGVDPLVDSTTVAAGSQWMVDLAGQVNNNVDGAGEQSLVLAARHLIPGVLSGMVLAAVLAAICSTADSQLVVAASAGANDIYATLIAGSQSKAHVLVNRMVVFGLGLAAMIVALFSELPIFDFVLTYGWAVLGASFGPQLILLLFWKRASYAGCVAGMGTGFVVALAWPSIYTSETVEQTGVVVYNLPLAFISAMVMNVVVSVLTADRDSAENVSSV